MTTFLSDRDPGDENDAQAVEVDDPTGADGEIIGYVTGLITGPVFHPLRCECVHCVYERWFTK